MTTRQFQESSALRIFLSYFKPHRKLFFLDMCCALMIAVIDLAFPYVSRWCMYQLLPESAYRTFFAVMAVVFCAYILRSVFTYIICYYGHTFGILVEADIRRDLFRHMQELSFDYYDRNRTGQLMSRLTADLFDITELAHHGPEDIFISGVTIVGALAIMFTIQWQLALVIACIIPVFFLVVWKCRKSMQDASIKVKQRTATINADIESGLSGIKTAKAFANEEAELEKFDVSNDSFKTSKRAFHRAMGRFNAVMEFFLCILSVAVISVGGFLIMQGRMDTVDLITFSLYITTFVNPVRKLSTFAELFANGTAGFARFVELMREEPAMQDAPDATTLSRVEGRIDVDHVSFAYQDDMAVLHDVDLHIRPGETIAVVGPSGGGKSTLCQLIPRFYDVTDGAVKIDGVDVRKMDVHQLRSNIAVVLQDVFLFSDTIEENIKMGQRKELQMEAVRLAAEDAKARGFIEKMDEQYETVIGERGVGLSGGQKQRISIARALAKHSPILVLDDSTSALDMETEHEIQQTLNALRDTTKIIIAHRISAVRHADEIIYLADGKIAERGTHEELLAKKGLYYDTYMAQYGALAMSSASAGEPAPAACC